jgi:hypothetical protein
MFTSVKNFFVSIYETLKRKIIGAYVRVKNWLVDTLTGEIMDDLNNMDVNPTFWDAVCRASSNVVLGKRAAHAETDTTKKRVIGAVIGNATIGICATGVAAIAALFGATFIGAFWTTVITFYGVAFVSNLVLELFKNHMLKKIGAVMEYALSEG